jgi:hypothetical protein
MPLVSFQNPISVIQRSPMSGVFGTSAFKYDKQGFIERVIGHWYCIQGNTLPVESQRHIDCASELFEFYVAFRDNVEKGFRAKGKVLHELYKTGSVKNAKALMEGLNGN